jgi:hypothetical protein
MRRVVLAVAVCLGIQLIRPAPAQAWWGWWDELSGVGPFQGLEFETRLYCFGQNQRPPDAGLTRSAAEQVASAFDLFNQVMTDAKLAIEEGRRAALVGQFGKVRAETVKASSRMISPATAGAVQDSITKLRNEISPETLCPKGTCGAARTTLATVDARLQIAEAGYQEAQRQATDYRMIAASAGVTYSACSVQRDVHRRGSINLTFRLLENYGDRQRQYAGGNQVNLATLVPTVSWRPLVGIPRFDVIDLAAGAGVYWLTSEGARAGGFDPISGIVLEPIRVDFHLPSSIAKRGAGGALASGFSYRRGWAIFPGGFAPNAFGITETPRQAERIAGEWVHNWAIFYDIGPIIHWWVMNKTDQ